jgi:hypothetical protein
MAVAPPLISRLAWPVAAAVSFAFLVGLALHGERPEPGLVRFEAAGFMKQFALEDVREVEIATPAGIRRFRRDGDWPQPIDGALRLLRDAGPMRVMTNQEVAAEPAATYGLDPAPLVVTARAKPGETFVVRFGASNPLGSGRYARIDGVEGIAILPGYVADAWKPVAP